jgi:hypothetical protein
MRVGSQSLHRPYMRPGRDTAYIQRRFGDRAIRCSPVAVVDGYLGPPFGSALRADASEGEAYRGSNVAPFLHTAQTIRAILLARATVARFEPRLLRIWRAQVRRRSSCWGDFLVRLAAARTARAPWTSSVRR